MAEPFASATTLKLAAVSACIQEQYAPYFTEQVNRAGSTTNRLFSPRAEAVVGDGETFQVEVAPSDSVRASTDMLSNPNTPNSFTAGSIKVRFNERDPSANDFTKIQATGRVDYWTLNNGSAGVIVDIAQRLYMELFKGFDFRVATLRNADRTARIATTSTKTNSDGLYSGGCSAYTSGSATCRLVITAGSVAALPPGSIIDIYTTGGTIVFSRAQVISRNVANL